MDNDASVCGRAQHREPHDARPIETTGRAFTTHGLVDLVLAACEESEDQTEIGDLVERFVCEGPTATQLAPLRVRRTRAEARDLKTTMIYTHVTRSGPLGVTSPPDHL